MQHLMKLAWCATDELVLRAELQLHALTGFSGDLHESLHSTLTVAPF